MANWAALAMADSPRAELLLGCGASTRKAMSDPAFREWSGLVTLDHNPDHHPDVLWDLEKRPLPFDSNQFDEIHAYEVLEHIGRQGDYISFFAEFSEYWRILKPDGLLFGHVPAWDSEWAWGDPSHRRVITSGTLSFLSQTHYRQVGRTASSDFRNIYKADFAPQEYVKRDEVFYFILRAIKPARKE